MYNKYLNCEFLYEDGDSNFNRVVRLKDGSLFTISSISKKSARNMGSYSKSQFVFGTPYDEGKTWSMPYPCLKFRKKYYTAPLGFLISVAGYLHVFLVRIKFMIGKIMIFKETYFMPMDDIYGKNLIIRKSNVLTDIPVSNNLIQLKEDY